jgi:nucleotide-binding universal stress UspA family protein/hemerythrin-like domain-containing protein
MYQHLLVPIDDSDLSVETVSQATAFAKALGARITFFHARTDYGATSDGALERSVSPELYVERAAGDAEAILAKADADARACGVTSTSIAAINDRPYEAILDAAEACGCDLIFMASHGRRGIRGLMLGSQTQKVLTHTAIPVLVASVESNWANPKMNAAVSIIRDEHRSLAAVLHGLTHLVREMRDTGVTADLQLIAAMLHYIRTFTEELHHPKEDGYLFAALRRRTSEYEPILQELDRQHVAEADHFADLEKSFSVFSKSTGAQFADFARSVDRFVDGTWEHMNIEEKVVIPAAKKHLMVSDWSEIADAFRENGDPRFADHLETNFQKLFSRIMNLAAQRRDNESE